MATFTGTLDPEFITPAIVTPSVVVVPAGSKPSNAADVINAGGGNDTIDAGGGNDSVTGGAGDDSVKLGAGNDLFTWLPGDGDDAIDGGLGFDTVDIIGNGGDEDLTLVVSGTHGRLIGALDNVDMDIDNVEKIVLRALGGADTISISDQTGTDLRFILVKLEGTLASGTGDGQVDLVRVFGSNGANALALTGSGGSVTISGLTATITIDGLDVATDSIRVETFIGDDVISAGALTGGPALFIDSGFGNDNITGSANGDTIVAGSGNDVVVGGRGDDISFLGAGADRFIWNAGDGTDLVEGQSQTDTVDFRASAQNDFIDLTANGGRVRLDSTIDGTSSLLDMDDVETMVFTFFGGLNELHVGDLGGTDLVGAITYRGGSSTDIVNAGAAINDMIITGGGGADSLFSGKGDDTFRYFTGSEAALGETVSGSRGINDTIQLFNTGAINFSNVTLSGLERLQFVAGNSTATFGTDQIGGSKGFERIAGGAGQDTVVVAADFADLSTVAVSGWEAAVDHIIFSGTDASGRVLGSTQSDIIIGRGFGDELHGGGGNDRFRYTAGSDVTVSEVIRGDAGTADTIELRSTGAIDFRPVFIDGVEVLRFATGISIATLSGGQMGTGEINRLVGNSSVNQVIVRGADVDLGTVLFNTWSGADRVTVVGTGGNDRLVGSRVGDGIAGSAGNDRLIGGNGADLLNGGIGADRMTSGNGNDVFVYTALDDSRNAVSGRDTILDFHAGDRIKLTAIDAKSGVPGNQAFVLDNGGAFSSGEIRQTVVGGDLLLRFNTDGDAAAEMSILLKNHAALLGNSAFLF